MYKKLGLILIAVSLVYTAGCTSNNTKTSTNNTKGKKNISGIIQKNDNTRFKVSNSSNKIIINGSKTTNNKDKAISKKNALNTDFKTKSEDKKISYKVYSNPRYGYNIDYPNNFKKNIKFDSDEGAVLESSDGKANIRVWGGNNVNNYTPSQYYKHVLNSEKNIYYKAQSGKWFVLSWEDGQNIEYEMYVVGEKSENGYLIQYPKSEKKYYDDIIKHINLSFKTPFVSESR